MTRAEISERVIGIVRRHLDMPGAQELHGFFDDLSADSLDIVEITMAIEEEFDLAISDLEMMDAIGKDEHLVTVGDVVDAVEKLLKGL